MASRSLNKVFLIGNLTRDPELRYTPQGTAVCTFGLATNRQWTTEEGEKKEEAEFHTIVAWARLAEIVAEYLKRGSQAFVEGRISTREWEGQDGIKRRTVEIVAETVIFLGGRAAAADLGVPADFGQEQAVEEPAVAEEPEEKSKKAGAAKTAAVSEGEEGDDIPF